MKSRPVKFVLLLSLLGGVAVFLRDRLMPSPTPPPTRGEDPFMAAAPPVASPGTAAGEADPVAATSDVDPLPDPPRGPFTTAPDGEPDDLKRISGVGPKLESLLNEQGITTFAQLAELTEDQVDQLQARLTQFPGRIRRDDWVAQARRLRDDDA